MTFGLGYLAIIGIPPFSGFFTKDSIIEAAWDKGGTLGCILAACALLGAGITAFYMTRVMLMTWFGQPSSWDTRRRPFRACVVEHEPLGHPHESPLGHGGCRWSSWRSAPLGAGAFLIVGQRFENFLAPVVGVPPSTHGFFTAPGGIAAVVPRH